MLFNFDFKGLKKHFPPLFLTSLFIAIIDVTHRVSKTFWTIVPQNKKIPITDVHINIFLYLCKPF